MWDVNVFFLNISSIRFVCLFRMQAVNSRDKPESSRSPRPGGWPTPLTTFRRGLWRATTSLCKSMHRECFYEDVVGLVANKSSTLHPKSGGEMNTNWFCVSDCLTPCVPHSMLHITCIWHIYWCNPAAYARACAGDHCRLHEVLKLSCWVTALPVGEPTVRLKPFESLFTYLVLH